MSVLGTIIHLIGPYALTGPPLSEKVVYRLQTISFLARLVNHMTRGSVSLDAIIDPAAEW